jgi:hypothetical protein
MEDRDELKEFASRVGREVSDEELEDYFTAPETSDEPGNAEEETEMPAPAAHLEAADETGDPDAGEDPTASGPEPDGDDPAREKSAEHGQG